MKNLFRHLLASESKGIRMNRIVSRTQWIVSQLVTNGFNQYEKDVSPGMLQMGKESIGWGTFDIDKSEGHECIADISKEDVSRILEVTKLSAWYIECNPKEVWFQLSVGC